MKKEEQQKLHEKGKICYVFRQIFLKKDADYEKYFKARDHCPYTGKFTGAAHNICILRYSISR